MSEPSDIHTYRRKASETELAIVEARLRLSDLALGAERDAMLRHIEWLVTMLAFYRQAVVFFEAIERVSVGQAADSTF